MSAQMIEAARAAGFEAAPRMASTEGCTLAGSGAGAGSLFLLFFVNMTACFQEFDWIIGFAVEPHFEVKVIARASTGCTHLPHKIADLHSIAL